MAWKGNIELNKQDKPFQQSPQCQSLIADGSVKVILVTCLATLQKKYQKLLRTRHSSLPSLADGLKYVERRGIWLRYWKRLALTSGTFFTGAVLHQCTTGQRRL
ncbi:hypothetical protein O9992_13835 [Vibrio lentus]|nr:hypothetical protein [Vibrio lentus]